MKNAFAVAVLSALFAVSAQAQEATAQVATDPAVKAASEAPALPAYDKEPYEKVGEGPYPQILHRERELQLAVHYSTPDMLNAVLIYLDADGKNQHAAWYTRTSEDATTFVVRGYGYTDCKWVFEEEATYRNR